MKIYNKLKRRLILRGFTKKHIINNRGLIGAVIDEFLKEDFYFAAKVPKLNAIDEQGTPIVGEDGSKICNCSEPKQSMFPNREMDLFEVLGRVVSLTIYLKQKL